MVQLQRDEKLIGLRQGKIRFPILAGEKLKGSYSGPINNKNEAHGFGQMRDYMQHEWEGWFVKNKV